MISAMQGAKLKAANAIHTARNTLLDIRPLICLSQPDTDAILKAVDLIDGVFAKLVTNQGEEQ